MVNANTDREGFYLYRCLIEVSCQACVIESSRILDGGSLVAIGYHARTFFNRFCACLKVDGVISFCIPFIFITGSFKVAAK